MGILKFSTSKKACIIIENAGFFGYLIKIIIGLGTGI
jgi:hypothetical protein